MKMGKTTKRPMSLFTIHAFIYVIVLHLFPLETFSNPSEIWWHPDWTYRMQMTIDNQSNTSSLTDFQTLIILNTADLITAGKMMTAGEDIRFVDESGMPAAYWIESGMNTTQTRIWVKVPSPRAVPPALRALWPPASSPYE